MSKLDNKIINEKLEEVFKKLDSAAKINISLKFVLRKVEIPEYWFYYAHKINDLFEKSICCVGKRILFQSRENSKNLILWSNTQRTPEHKMEVQLGHKSHYFGCTNGFYSNGMSRLCYVHFPRLYYDICM